MVGLHQDILEAITEFLDTYPDLLAVSLTCSALRPKAVQCLLSLRPVTLTNERIVRAFHDFIYIDPEVRGRHIRGLVTPLRYSRRGLIPHDSNADIATIFIAIIKSATRLKHLTLSLSDLYPSYLDDSRVVPVVGGLSTLEDLAVLGDSQRGHELLRIMQSPVRTIRIRNINYDPASPVYLDSMSNLAATLESLELGLGQIYIHEFETRPRFPSVHSLTIAIVRGPPRLDALLHMFPSLSGSLFLFHPSPIAFNEDTIRQSNKRAQESSSNSWKRIDHVSCPPKLLFALNISCSIRRITLDCWDDLEFDVYISEILRATPPQFLELTNLRLVPPVLDVLSSGLFPTEVRTTMTHLLLTMRCDGVSLDELGLRDIPAPLQWDSLVDIICSVIKSLQHLAYLRVIIECFVQPNHFDAAYTAEFVTVVRHREGSHWRRAAEVLVAAVPSLRTIVFTSNGLILNAGYWRLASGWTQCAASGDTSAEDGVGDDLGRHWRVEELGSEEMKSFVKREGLSNARDETLELWDLVADELVS
ncbi:hypothetical protein BD309DRAFT_905107 [Dichomitus squalens]|uniref:Uncharacterized protein n=1 Tax=Dichomitus squalens TaxID=114155 RepID=A0A4Q9NAZ9_9APHY|nr:hypothetical protein BD309DRAFT_905107 [Dichomitus squalens]TBU60404.1 hypothetical protein BD310DRAFT_847696 [Dichomitus squalens]